jgi:putative intracellular protease/amidase
MEGGSVNSIRTFFCTSILLLASVATQAQSTPPPKVAIFLFDNVQTIDYAAPLEVFGTGRLFNTYTVGQKPGPITTIHGTQVIPDYTFETMPKPDILVIPGGGKRYPDNKGPFARGLPYAQDPAITDWIRRTAKESQIVMSVCNGAFGLAEAGLLDGLEATTTAPLIPMLQKGLPDTKVRHDERFVDNGHIITSAGLTAGMDASLHVIERIYGRGVAEMRALGLEYNWDPQGTWTRANLADQYMKFDFQGFDSASWTPIGRTGNENHWVNRWTVVMSQPASEVLAIMDKTLETNHTYQKMPVTWQRAGKARSEEAKSYWQFTDEDGAQWLGIASVTPIADEQGRVKYELKLTITKQ